MSTLTMVEAKKEATPAMTSWRNATPLRHFELPRQANPAAEAGAVDTTSTERGFGYDFGRIPMHAPSLAIGDGTTQRAVQSCPLAASPRACPFGGACHTCPAQVQAKLAIGRPDDIYEQEADRIADQIIRMPDPAVDGSQPDMAAASVQTKRSLQRSAENAPEFDNDLKNRLSQSRSGGSPLPGNVRAFLEPRFGFDFSQVRVHAGGEAARLNRALAAQAFTHGSDIYFGDGKYDPGVIAGKYLLAHELAHVVQQTDGVQTKRLADHINVQMKCAACEAEEEIQRSIEVLSAPELVQRKVVCDELGENCQSVPDDEGPTTSEQNYTPAATPPEQNYTPATPPEQNYTPAAPLEEQNYTPATPPEQNYTPAAPLEEQNYTPGPGPQPRSLSQSLDPAMLSVAEMKAEIDAIRSWLIAHSEEGPQQEQLQAVQASLEKKLTKPRPPAAKKMGISKQGINFIIEPPNEGFCPNLYDDLTPNCGKGKGNCTIGYGHWVHSGPCNGDSTEAEFQNGIDKQTAQRLFTGRLANAIKLVNEKVKVELTQCQFDALVSFTYNANLGGLEELLPIINDGRYQDVPEKIRKTRLLNGRLTGRRSREADYFLKSDCK